MGCGSSLHAVSSVEQLKDRAARILSVAAGVFRKRSLIRARPPSMPSSSHLKLSVMSPYPGYHRHGPAIRHQLLECGIYATENAGESLGPGPGGFFFLFKVPRQTLGGDGLAHIFVFFSFHPTAPHTCFKPIS
jgi:hypothetical protein